VASSMAWLAPDARGERVAWRRLAGFRSRWYGCAGPWADALFELADAVLCAGGPVCSLPRLSLEPVFGRGHGSVYAALARGAVNVEALEDLLAAARPRSWPLVFAVDGTSWPRCDAEASPGRGFYYHPSRHSAGKPIVAGWWYQQVSQLNFDRDSQTWPAGCRRIHSREDPVAATVRQVRGLLARLGPAAAVPLFAFDGGYDPIALADALAADRAQLLVRIKGDRVFYGDPPPRAPGGRGRPRRHGARFDCKKRPTWGPPAAQLTTRDGAYGTVRVTAWTGLHPMLAARGRWARRGQAPIVRGWVIRVDVEHLPRPLGRVKKILWLWWSGPPGMTPDLGLCWRAYLHRFDIEHAIKFQKSVLGWVTPTLRHPEQADRWTAVILAASAQLVLTRPAGFRSAPALGTPPPPGPAHSRPGSPRLLPGSRAPSPGSQPQETLRCRAWTATGSTTGPAQRYPAIKKAA
jgi:hypothetical protein